MEVKINALPFGDRLLMKKIEKREEFYGEGLIIIPSETEASSPNNHARVIAVGPDVKSDIKVGDVVLLSRHLPSTLIDDEEVIVVNEEFIIGVLENYAN
jgi:co-chaperonin GroES (HSP10)